MTKRRYLIGIAAALAVLAVLALTPHRAAAAELGYTVQPGDSLTGIAYRYGVTLSQLASANGLRWNSWVYSGQYLVIPGASSPAPAPVATSGAYVVRAGDTLSNIAVRHGVTLYQLASANGLSVISWVYTGQRLTIPGQSAPSAPVSSGGVYVVQAGNTLFSIARWHGTTVSALRAANGLASDIIYVGQRLTIPGGSSPVAPAPAPAPVTGVGERWIDVNLSAQRVTAYEGSTPVYSALASTGTWQYPTVTGTYYIYVKYAATLMTGPGYYLPNVPYTMYFYRGYAIHGTYWHSNFGTPMSHGCVNLSTPDAQWFYNFASVGTRVVSHY